MTTMAQELMRVGKEMAGFLAPRLKGNAEKLGCNIEERGKEVALIVTYDNHPIFEGHFGGKPTLTLLSINGLARGRVRYGQGGS